uniref:Ribonuclease H-like domain, reverse transcriptase, RNA-dependent DNA polymerase n=1 Tax=Tanacetum cinerariifolium TaxID=118510 RepID=A0A6L2JAQ5_TANCI|nr:ribonuclease H-like domain, reverse transcriptase, RNA-dependent DNA polymerase [Tanacetum cinerariifolium]
MAGSDNESDNASVHNETTNTQQQPNIQPQIITSVSNNNAKFSYLKKDEYEVWAMKMEYWITNNDMNIWKSIHDDHVADFHYMDDARDIWNAVKARFDGNAESKKMRKSMLKRKEASTAGDAGEFALVGVTSKNNEYFIQDQAYKNSLKTLEKQKRVLQRNQLSLEDKIRVLSIQLENTSNLLKHSERINADFKIAKKDLQTKLDNHLAQTKKWKNSSKNLFKLIDSSMSVKTKVGLRYTNCISENELGWDDSAFSVFTTNSEDVEGRPIFHRFAKTDSMKAVAPPLSGDYTSLSDHIDLDESQMSYGTKSSTSCDSKSVSNDFVSCNDIDKSLEVNTNDFASSDSSVKSLEHQPNDSTSCASTSSVSTSMNEAEIESNVGTPIKEPIIVQDLPSFTGNSSDKNEHTSRTSCNKNGYFNKKAGHFRKNASSVSKLCFVCGSGTHLIKDCDFYEKKMANTTFVIRVGPTVRPQSVPTGKPKVKPIPTGKPKVTPVPTGKPKVIPVSTGKPKVTPVPTSKPKVTPVPTGKLQVSTLVPTGRPNRPFPVPTDRGYSPLVIFGWWSQIYGQLMLSPQQVVLGNHIEKVFTGYPRTIVDLIHLHTDANVADLLTKAFAGPRVFNSPMLHLLRVEMVINSSWIRPILGTKELSSLEQTALENIKNKDSYDSNIDELDLLVTPLSDANDDECFDSGGDVDEINDFEDGYYDSEGDILYLESLLSDDTTPNLPPEVFLDRELKNLRDAPIDDLMIAPDLEVSRARGFVHHPLEILSLACLYMGIRYLRS